MRPIEPVKQNFIENPQRPGTYDFERNFDRIGIKYFVIKPIRQPKFRHQGAAFGLESWSNGSKQIFTGLIQLPQTNNVLFGNLVGKDGTKSLICLIMDEPTIQMLYFESFCPKTINSQMAFLRAHFKIGQ